MGLIHGTITRDGLKAHAAARFGDMVKAVVDIERGVMALGAELHADDEAELLDDGSRQANLWGINLYPDETGEEFVEFDSMINVRPGSGNRSRSVEDPVIRETIRRVVDSIIVE